MPCKLLANEEEFESTVRDYAEVHVFMGYGERAQYADVEEVLTELKPHLLAIEARSAGKPFLAIYGGDIAREHAPDLGWLMLQVHQRYKCHLMAVQSAGEPDTHSDYVYVCAQQFEDVEAVQADGSKQVVQQVLYGGTRQGQPVGGSRYYLGPVLASKNAEGTRLLRNLFVMGGGGVAKEELQYADAIGLPWLYIPSRARNEAAYNSTFGPVHDWVKGRLDSGPHTGAGAYATVAGHQ